MSPSPAVVVIVVLLPACNRTVDESFGDLGEGGIDAPTTEAEVESSSASDESAGPDVPRDPEESSGGDANDDAPPATCGNGSIDDAEDCDGDELGLQTCMTWGFLAGEVSCADDCTVDTSACLSEAVCGDGTISGEEDCEATTDQTCVGLGLGDGELSCAKACSFDVSACSCRGAGESCVIDWLNPGGQSNCCPSGYKGNVYGACGAGSGTCS